MNGDLLTVVAVAFGLQLAVLPGEKVQFIIAGLSTRYHPLLVVSAAGSAFAGWTALEILFGEALKAALPGVYLDAITAGLFLVFAVMLIRSAPAPGESVAERSEDAATQTDGGVATGGPDVSILGREVPEYFGGFLPIFAMMAAGEFGDKTQLVTISLAATYGAHPGIWIGEMLAIIPVSLANAYFFHRFSHAVDLRKAHYAGVVVFAFFGADTVLSILTDFSVWETVVAAVSDAVTSLL